MVVIRSYLLINITEFDHFSIIKIFHIYIKLHVCQDLIFFEMIKKHLFKEKTFFHNFNGH